MPCHALHRLQTCTRRWQRATLRTRGVAIESAPVTELVGPARLLEGIRLRSGRIVPVHAAFIVAPIRMTSSFAERLGCAFDETPIGSIVSTDMWKQTTVPGVYAAGDNARMQQGINFAVADGTAAGVGTHKSLIAESIAA